MTIKELEQQLLSLPKSEKVQIVQMLIADISDTWPGIEKTPGVVGGDACIMRTRIPVWALEGYRRLGLSDAQLLENFPTLKMTDLLNAWAYVASHRAEIDQAIHDNEEA